MSSDFVHWIALQLLTVLLGIHKCCILGIGDCFTDSVIHLVFVCKNHIVLAKFQYIDGSARWLTSSDFNHTQHAGSTDPQRSCCSACPTLQRKKLFIYHQKAAQIVVSTKLTNKINH